MSRRRDERGSALVEFTLVVPVFLLVVVAAASMVWLMGARSSVTGAARDAARYASIRHVSPACPTASPCYPTPAEVLAYAKERAGGYGVDAIQLNGVDGLASDADGDPVTSPVQWRNQEIVVTVTRTLPNAFNSFAGVFGLGDLDYTTDARSRAE